MYNLVNSNFNRTYNPGGKQNALSDIKRLLISRDTDAQNKACGYLIEVISRYKNNSNERARMVEYLLGNDIVVFLCEATSNLDFTLFRSVVSCIRLLWHERGFFEEHSAHAMAAGVRALVQYAPTDSRAVDACLHFLCDLLNGISSHQTTPALSHQSAYSTDQLLACLSSLAPRISTNTNSVLCSALVLHALVSYQPAGLIVKGVTASALAGVVGQWFELLMGSLNRTILVGESEGNMFLVVICQIGMDVIKFIKLLDQGKQSSDFVQSILVDDQEIRTQQKCALDMKKSVYGVLSELAVFVKDNEHFIKSEEYSVFLKLLLSFFQEITSMEILGEFCDSLFSKGYLTLLPQAHIDRNDTNLRKVSTLVLGEMLRVLAEKYLFVHDAEYKETCAKDIHMGLVEIQNGIEKPRDIGMQLQKNQPYGLLIYIYFYCQSSENPEEATGPLLPYLVQHILSLPRGLKPPGYILKALWLVFAMSTISNGSTQSLEERVYLEKATDRLVSLLRPEPAVYYTHNPAILLWAFTSLRIPDHVRVQVVSQWLKLEDTLPEDLTKEVSVWELLLNVLIQNKDPGILLNCREALTLCLDGGDEERKKLFASLIWSMLPNILSKALIDCDRAIDTNITYVLETATTLLPVEVDQTACLKVAVLITTTFSKTPQHSTDMETRYHYEYVCLKLSLLLLGLSINQNDTRVLLTFTNRAGFLPSVLTATNSADERVSVVALQLLSYVVHYFTRNNYKPQTIIQIQTDLVIKSLRRNSTSDRGASLLQLVYMVLNSGVNTPLSFTQDLTQPSDIEQSNALRALMFRIQLMLCCRESKNQSSAGWKTLSAVFKHAIILKHDPNLVATLTSQPWTYTLIRFQLTQSITREFLTFTHNWLKLLRITIKKSQEEKKRHLCRHSLIIRTLISMTKKLAAEDDKMKEMIEKILSIVKEILDDCCVSLA